MDTASLSIGEALLGNAEGDVVDIEIEHVGAVEVTDGNPDLLASVSAEVDSLFVPGALNSHLTVTARSNHTTVLGAHRPLLDHDKVGSRGTACGYSDTVVFSGVAGILSAGIEGNAVVFCLGR